MRYPAPISLSPRYLLLSCAVVLTALLLAVQLAQSPRKLLNLPLYDYVAFWAASQLNTAGEDPYDPAQLEAVERSVNPGPGDVLLMWPAPWALTFLAPFTRLGPQVGHLLWLLAQLGVLLAAVEIIWRLWGGDLERRWIAWLFTFTYMPCYFLLVTGQFGAIILLGLAGFLYFLRQKREIAAGACLALVAVKPQLTFLFWVALLVWTVHGRHWRVAIGGILAGFVLLILPLWENPLLPIHYWHALTRRTQTHSHWSPVFGTALRFLLAPHSFWPQFIPMVPGLLWLAWYWRRYCHAWDWSERMPALLFASFLATPYGAWPFDLVVLLLPLLRQAARLTNASTQWIVKATSCHLLIGIVALGQILCGIEYFWFLWMTPALLTLYLACGAKVESGHIFSSNWSIWRTRSAGGAVNS